MTQDGNPAAAILSTHKELHHEDDRCEIKFLLKVKFEKQFW